jgi:hypothetical protein
MSNGRTYYECHITLMCDLSGRSFLKHSIEKAGWRYSAIDGDIVEGNGVKCYATRHYNPRNGGANILQEMLVLSEHLESLGFEVTRKKMEHVIFDTKSAQVCPEDCLQCIRPGETI